MQKHDVMPVIGREEECLPHETFVGLRQRNNTRTVEVSEVVGEASVYASKSAQQCGFLARC